MTKEEYNYWKPQIAEYEKEQLRLSRVSGSSKYQKFYTNEKYEFTRED